MIRINLLPVRAARKKENIRRQISIFFLCIVFALCAMWYVSDSMSRSISDHDDKIKSARKELSRYQATVKEAKKIKQDLQNLRQKMDVIIQLEADRTGPVRIMDALTSLVLADKMWLRSLSETKGIITLTGVATDNKTVADFMTNLEKSPCFGVVNLISSKQINVKERKFKEFRITCLPSKEQPKKEQKTP